MSDTEFNWLIAHPEEAQKYAGEYIALVGESIVAHGKDFKAVLAAAETRPVKNLLSTKFLLLTGRSWCDGLSFCTKTITALWRTPQTDYPCPNLWA